MVLAHRGILCLAAALLTSCSAEAPSDALIQKAATEPVLLAQAQQGPSSSSAVAASVDSIWKQQKLIRNAELNVEVESVEAAAKEVEAIAARHDGLVADTEAEQDQRGNRRTAIRVRVPSARFDAAMADFRQLGTVTREKTTTEDITKAYADLETRLAVKKAAEERIRAILSSRTGNLADVLNAERELSRITEEIEQLQGEKRYYDQRVAVSIVSIELRAAGSSLRPGVFAPVSEALRDSFSVLSRSIAAIIYLVVFLAPWMLITITVWWAAKKIRRRARPGTSV